MHVEEVGDRAAVVLVSALIVITSFQTDLGLGPIQYLLWFDWFNIALTTLLFACLAVCFYHHHLYVTDREEYAMLHNQCLRWALPFGYFPILLTSLVLWGFNRHSAAPWVMLCVGWFTLTVFCARIIRKLGDDVGSYRLKLVEELRSADPASDRFVEVLRRAFDVFDGDKSGSISMDELRVLLECLYPNLKRTELAIISLEIKPFFNNNGELNETTFVDTVLHVISSHVVPSADERLKAPRSDVVEKWMSVKGVAVEGASSAASALRWGNLRTQFRALARSSSSQVQVTPAGGVNSRFAAPD